MAGGLPHPILLSTKLHMDEMTIMGQSVEVKHVFYTWIGMALLFIFAGIVRRRLTLVPGGAQNFAEVLVGGLENQIVETLGEEGRRFVPVLAGLFIYILGMNLMGLIPGFDAPTANINTNVGMAVFVFLYYQYVGIQRWGGHYIHHFLGPQKALIPLMLPIELVSHLTRPVSLTLRLFGNIRGEETVLILFFVMAPMVSTLPIYALFLLAKCLQAFIFFMLAMYYLKGALDHAH
ncbi:MAG: F0F1 ATP synthase subunit A [Betaproteobacteria bacterium]|nr:F0F1 ATP synthase subunit A [Betaproteobacteria bacterium]